MSLSLRLRALAVLLPFAFGCAAAQAACQFAKVAELPVSRSEQAYPLVTAKLNGKPVSMLLDTGSNWTALTQQGARAQGMSVEASLGYAYGVGGVSSNMAAKVEAFELGSSQAKNIKMWVLGSSSLGAAVVGLIGADYLMQMDVELALAEKLVKFFHTRDCADAYLGYWDKDAMEVPLDWAGSFDKRPLVTVELNGKKMVALVDTGASSSIVYRRTAKALGVIIDDAQAAGQTEGVGEHKVNIWPARFNFKLGDESIQNVKMTVMDTRSDSDGEGFDMILGQDWLLAHRVLFSLSQKRMIYSYLGGRVFTAP